MIATDRRTLPRLIVAAALLLAGAASPWLDAAAAGERPAMHAPDACPTAGHNHAYCALLGATPALFAARLAPRFDAPAAGPVAAAAVDRRHSPRTHLPHAPRAPPAV